MSALERFSPATREWFEGAFDAPTAAQDGAWAAIAERRHALVVAPTGSGKTLSAFLWAIDQLVQRPVEADEAKGTRVLYISPIKALAVDVERNLRAPLAGVTRTAHRLGATPREVTVGVRSGDTDPATRRTLLRNPPDVLITTPESLYLMLTSSARETLRTVETVIVDEVHAVAGTKRGAHLALSIERLDALLPQPVQRIGLSATVRPHEEVARFLGGRAPVSIVAPPSDKEWQLKVVVPVDDMSRLSSARPRNEPREGRSAGAVGEPFGDAIEGFSGDASGATAGSGADDRGPSIWPHVEQSLVEEILRHRSTIVFANSRGLAEKLTARLNELHDSSEREPATRQPSQVQGVSGRTKGVDDDAPVLARAHHGSVSREQRAIIEDDLKSGRLRCVVATSSLELGIDMGEVDLVIQVESPPNVASGLQRVGRAGHQVGGVSRGLVYPKHRADLLHAAVTVERMRAGLIEQLAVPANPLDVLAQQTVAATALEPLDVEGWFETVRASAPFSSLPRSAYEATLDLLAGRYPSDRFAELRPRLVWDRDEGTLTARPGAQRLAITSGGTIPDRGLFGVFMAGEKPVRVGELDEEMVYESRVQDVFALGATSWRIQEITHDRVIVTPAFGEPGRLPFWRGDGIGRPAELGRAMGAYLRELQGASAQDLETRLETGGLDEKAARNLGDLVREQREATGQVPTDRTLLVERFRDELGDWRLILHSTLGMQVHSPWALAVAARLRERFGVDGGVVASDDGIVARLPDMDSQPPGAELFVFDADELEELVTAEVGGSALFASRFRENAARALLLPGYEPGRRSPLWQQRQRSAQLLEVVREYPEFPIVLETVREVLRDVYDVPALLQVSRDIANRTLQLVEVQTPSPSPFARNLLFGYVGAFLYEGDTPLAERRAAALALDPALLGELLGRVELRELLDGEVIARTEAELQRLAPDRRAIGEEGVADLLRILGPLSIGALGARLRPSRDSSETVVEAEIERMLDSLLQARRIIAVQLAGRPVWAAVEDAGRLRDALGVPPPRGVSQAFLEPVADPLGDLVSRWARTHGPFPASALADDLGLGVAVATQALARLAADRRVIEGEFRPDGSGGEWCDAEVLRRLRTRSLAALRKEVEPVAPEALGRFLPSWQGVGGNRRGVDGVLETVEQLAGVALPASAWESLVLPARVRDYSPAMLDELTASGEVVWAGHGTLAGSDGWLSLQPGEIAHVALPLPSLEFTATETQQRLIDALGGGGAYFFRAISDQIGATDDEALLGELWGLAWAGLVTNDTLAPLRSRLGGGTHRTKAPAPRARGVRGRSGLSKYARPSLPLRQGPPSAAGRWSLLPEVETDATRRAQLLGELLLERHGVVTRGAVQAEGVLGGFALAYKVLSGFEEGGRARRGYFVEGLGAAQFAAGPTVDRLRTFSRDPDARPALDAVALAATDPANPYGAALAWPDFSEPEEGARHRPGRKAGALVVLVDGELALYLERGGKTLLTASPDPAVLAAAASALVTTLRGGGLGRITVERADGAYAIGTPVGEALEEAGFERMPRGLRLHT